jgi:hypothetical protein
MDKKNLIIKLFKSLRGEKEIKRRSGYGHYSTREKYTTIKIAKTP